MRAVVLVGGFGTRLRPLTLHRPKQMLPILGRPMIEWVASWLAANGVEDVVLSLGYRPEAFTAAYPEGRCAGVTMRYAVDPFPLDTAGAIRFAALSAGIDRDGASFLVINGDVLTDLAIADVVDAHHRCGAEATITLTRVEDPSRYGVVPIDADGRVESFIEKPEGPNPPSHWINAGTYVFEPRVLDRIPADRRASIERETFPAMAAEGTLYAVQSDAAWIDVGTAETYRDVQLDLAERTGWSPTGVELDPTAHIERSVLGPGAQVGAGATVRSSVIGRGTHIGAGATVCHSVVGEDTHVGPGARLEGLCVVGDGERVEAGVHLDGARVPEDA